MFIAVIVLGSTTQGQIPTLGLQEATHWIGILIIATHPSSGCHHAGSSRLCFSTRR